MSKIPDLGERGSGRPSRREQLKPLEPTLYPPRSSGPFPRNSFRVNIGKISIGLCLVSPLHLGSAASNALAPPPSVILRRAVNRDRTLYEWRYHNTLGKDDLRTVSVVLLDQPRGEPVIRWDLVRARPIRWSGPELDALSNGIAFEELEITYEDVIWRDQP